MAENPEAKRVLVLGIGNVLMGDEGVGVSVVQQLDRANLPAGVEYLDGGTGSFQLLEPLGRARRVILIDATDDGRPVGSVTRLTPRFSSDYPRRLTAHDIGLGERCAKGFKIANAISSKDPHFRTFFGERECNPA